MRSLVLIPLIPVVLAFELPFGLGKLFGSKPAVQQPLQPQPVTAVVEGPRIAVIGAGAAGSSAAFWLSKGKERSNLTFDVDVYERSDYIGGRSTVIYPYDNTSLPALELGASIFVGANKNMMRATREFNLTLRNFKEEETSLGVWNGKGFQFTYDGSYWDTAKMLLRFGYFSPKRSDKLVKQLVADIDRVYKKDTPKWQSIESLVGTLGWGSTINITALEYFRKGGVTDRYIFDLIEAATRVNYGQNVDQLHGIVGAVSMAANEATSVVGGNYKVFENLLKASEANVYLNNPVASISQRGGKWRVRTSRGSLDYDAVIIAAPFHQTDIDVPTDIYTQVPPQPYVHLHTTFVISTSRDLSSEYFEWKGKSAVPHEILTTFDGVRTNETDRPEFNSVAYNRRVGDDEYAFKIFSDKEMSDEWLEKMFPGGVKWVYRKLWQSYPKLPPTSTFPPLKLEKGLYYVNSFEPLISTMETEIIASRNVIDQLLADQYGASICPATLTNATDEGTKDYLYGWDC